MIELRSFAAFWRQLVVVFLVAVVLFGNGAVRAAQINNTTMRVEKSKLKEMTCNDNSFRIELEVVWLNQTKLFDDKENGTIFLAYKHKPCVLEATWLNESPENLLVCDDQWLFLTYLNTSRSPYMGSNGQTIRIIYNSYYKYEFQIFYAAKKTPTSTNNNSTNNSSTSLEQFHYYNNDNLNQSDFRYLPLSSMFKSSKSSSSSSISKKSATAFDDQLTYEVVGVCMNEGFVTPEFYDCYHYRLNINGRNMCTFELVQTYSPSIFFKYIYLFIIGLLILILLVNVVKWTFFRYEILR